MSITNLTATDLLGQLNAGQLTSVEVTKAFLDRIEEADESIGAYVSVLRDSALSQAESVDRRRTAGEPIGLLGGLPVAVKDVQVREGEPAPEVEVVFSVTGGAIEPQN